MTATTADAEDSRPFRLAGQPLAHWAFALRIWLAMMIALAVAFWLQLDSASSSAVTVAILAQPQRGAAFRKAAFRFGATIVGVTASIVITGIFTQSRDLFVVAFAAWMALAVYVATLYDGTRAYGAVLSGYTVAIVAVSQIDSPQNVFMNGLSRLSVVALGIATIALVNDVFAAPDLYPGVRQRLRQGHDRTLGLARALLRGEAWQPADVVDLLKTLTGTRLDIFAVSAEGPAGSNRAAAAGSAVVAMINALSKIRALSVVLRGMPPGEMAVLHEAFEADNPALTAAALDQAMTRPERSQDEIARLTLAANLMDSLRLAADELAAMEAGRRPRHRVSMPIHRDRELARLAAARVFLVVLVSAAFFILSSWPMTSAAFSLVGVLAGLSSTMPDPRAFAKGAMTAFPIAFVVAGVTEYILLDGVDSFPLLMIGMAPAILGSCLLFLNPKTGPIGFLLLVFTIVFFPPSNPQSYSAQSYVVGGCLDIAGSFVFSMLLFSFFPVTDRDRRRWMVNRARQDLLDAMAGCSRHAPDEMAYLTADRIVALDHFKIGQATAKRWRITYTLLLSNLTLVVGRGHAALDRLTMAGVPKDRTAAAHDAFARLDPSAMRAQAEALLREVRLDQAEDRREAAQAIADLAVAARLVDDNVSILRHLRHVFTS